jgi:predicted nucleic acid-binding protein
VSRASATPAGTLVLDSEGLAKAVLRAREVTQWLALALADDLRVITSAATVVEVAHPRLNRPALEWTLSRVVVEPVTEPIARRAAAILAEAGLHGHRYAIDAMLSATALAAPGPVTVLTSDPDDIATLCGRDVTVIKVLRDGPAFAERGNEAEFGAQPVGVDRSLAARGVEPCLVFELAQQALQPERVCRVALGGARCGVPRGMEVQHGHGLFQPGFLPFPCRRGAIGH